MNHCCVHIQFDCIENCTELSVDEKYKLYTYKNERIKSLRHTYTKSLSEIQ